MAYEFNPENLRKQYASLNDDALLAIDRSELVEAAQKCLDAEMAARGLRSPVSRKAGNTGDLANEVGDEEEIENQDEPDWLPDAASAASFTVYPGGDAAIQLDAARHALKSAGIPCYAAVRKDAGPPVSTFYELMIPGAFSLTAQSVLDRDVYNPQLEEEWRNHFETMSDDDFRTLDLASMTAGWQDRVERLTRAYEDELDKRKKSRPTGR